MIADVQPAGEAEQEVATQGRRALAVKVVVARREEVEALVRQVLGAFGTIDILVNCAQTVARAHDRAQAGEDYQHRLPVRGPLCPEPCPQCHAAKAGVIHLTRVLAVELARHGINVNAIAPALVLTPPLKTRWEASPEMRAYHLGKVALGRAAE